MNSFVFRDIINNILAGERIDLTALAAKADADRSYLSKVKNSTEELKIGPTILRKVKRAFPGYFQQNNENNIELEAKEPSAMQIFHLLAKTLESHGRILDRIDEKMARESTQATIAEKVKASEANLQDIRKDVTKLVQRQELAIEEIREQFLKLQVRRTDPSPDVRKKRGQTDGNE